MTSQIIAALAFTGIVTSAAALTGETRAPSAIPAMVLHNDANKLVISRPGTGTAIPGSGFTLVVLNPYNSSAS
ncbi:MAG: hypothetical protein ABJA20_16950 [Novosphingobium sp.]